MHFLSITLIAEKVNRQAIKVVLDIKAKICYTLKNDVGDVDMNKNVIITISREFGSGGRIIGSKVAEALNIPFYDRKIMEITAENSGLAVSFVEDTEQRVKNKFLHNLAFGGYHMGAMLGSAQLSLSDKLFISTCETIRSVADSGDAVIVGRCADYVLKDRKNVINIFIYADDEHKRERAIKEYGLLPNKADSEVKSTNKQRANHYNYYTEQIWGDKSNYQLCLNSGFLGIDNTVKIIVDAVKEFKNSLND